LAGPYQISNRCHKIGVALGLFVAAHCAVAQAAAAQSRASLAVPVPADARIVLMPPDIRYYLISAGGNPELQETWSADAESRLATALAAVARTRGANVGLASREDVGEPGMRYERLHAAVGEAIIVHVVGAAALPSKRSNRISDWTLGPGVNEISERTGADYALFVHYRENRPAGGRIAFAILAAAANTVIPTGSEHGFASLVNLATGDLAWFCELTDQGLELRDADGATALAEWLLDELSSTGFGTSSRAGAH